MTWTDYDITLFQDGDILTESNLTTYVGNNLLSLPHHIALDAADRDVGTTTSELSLWSTTAGGVTVPANKMGTSGTVTMRLCGQFLYNNNTANTLTLRLKFGGATVLTIWAETLHTTLSASTFGWWLEATVQNRAATNSQLLWSRGGARLNTASLSGFAHFSPPPTTSAVDTTANQVIDVTAQWNASSANNTIRKNWGITTLARN